MKTKEEHKAEFIELINGMMSFPARIKFTLHKIKETDKQSIVVSALTGSSQKKKLENIRLTEAELLSFHGSTAVLDVRDCENPEEVYEEVRRLSEIWEGTLHREKVLF